MGPTRAELIARLEEAFGLEIPRRDALRIRTPADAIEYFLGRVPAVPVDACVETKAFLRLRRAIAEVIDAERDRVEATTLLSAALPPAGRRKAWVHVGARLGAKHWPRLVRPRWVVTPIAMACAATFLFVLPRLDAHGFAVAFAGALATALALAGLCTLATRHLCCEFPRSLLRVGDVAHLLLEHDEVDLEGLGPSWSRESVAVVVREVVQDTLGWDDFDQERPFRAELRLVRGGAA